jgi:cytochrome c peroxidase
MNTTFTSLALACLAYVHGTSETASAEHETPALPPAVTDADYRTASAQGSEMVELGRLLFFDKVLSGNRNISCATCHHPSLATGDAVALPLGEGARGLGPERRAGTGSEEAVHGRVPRNSPPLFNLGAREFTRMYHDGRVEVDTQGHYASGFISPARWKLPEGLDSALAAQAMFPPTSPAEMAGQAGENEVADARRLNNVAGAEGVWDLLAGRLAAIPEYVELFREAFPDDVHGPEDVTFVQAANAIAAFEAEAFRSDRSPFDLHLRGERALAADAERGMQLFYGAASCSSCHSGPFQTDHDFHSIAMPQVGPGKGDGTDAGYWRETGLKAFVEDFGRGRVTVREEHRYRFRTPSLRNVAETGPWGHAGSFTRLEDAVRHHLDPVGSLEEYRAPADLLPPLEAVHEVTAAGSALAHAPLPPGRLEGFRRRDAWVQESVELRGRIAATNELPAVDLDDDEVADLLAFLESLTDPHVLQRSDLVPERVPSGLPVED